MRTDFPNNIHACHILSTFYGVRAPISVLRNISAAGSFLIPFQVTGSCGYERHQNEAKPFFAVGTIIDYNLVFRESKIECILVIETAKCIKIKIQP